MIWVYAEKSCKEHVFSVKSRLKPRNIWIGSTDEDDLGFLIQPCRLVDFIGGEYQITEKPQVQSAPVVPFPGSHHVCLIFRRSEVPIMSGMAERYGLEYSGLVIKSLTLIPEILGSTSAGVLCCLCLCCVFEQDTVAQQSTC